MGSMRDALRAGSRPASTAAATRDAAAALTSGRRQAAALGYLALPEALARREEAAIVKFWPVQ